MNVSQAKVAKILSSYHLRIDHSVKDAGDDNVAVKCDAGWVLNDQHRTVIKSEWFEDMGYLCGYFKTNVKPCHCPACMQTDDWVHDLRYLRSHIQDILSKLGIVNYRWNSALHTVAGFFTCRGYDEIKPVFIQWTQSGDNVRAFLAMNNWDSVHECEREPIRSRTLVSPSTNSLYNALMTIRGDMHTPISASAEDLDSEACINLGMACASQFAREFIFRDATANNNVRALNKRDERKVRCNEVWWASLYEPDDVMRQLKAQQNSYQCEIVNFHGGGLYLND